MNSADDCATGGAGARKLPGGAAGGAAGGAVGGAAGGAVGGAVGGAAGGAAGGAVGGTADGATCAAMRDATAVSAVLKEEIVAFKSSCISFI